MQGGAASDRGDNAAQTRSHPRMKLRLLSIAAFALAALQSPAASAQPDAPALWDEPRAVARAIARAPEVRRAAALLAEARARRTYGTVPVIGNPTVGVRAMVGVPDTPAATWGLVVGIPFDVAGARARRREESSWGEREAEARVDAATNDARHRARVAWVEVSLAEAAVAVAEARRVTSEEMLARVRARADVRASTALDVVLAERDAAEAEADLAAAQRHREISRARFRDALDLDATEPAAVPPLAAPALPGTSLAADLDAARARRAEPRALAAAASRLRTASRRLRAEAVSPLLVAAEVEWQGYTQASIGASAQWALPVARTAQGERAEALAAARTAEVERELAARGVARETAAAWHALRHAVDEVASLDARVIPAAERTVALTETLAGSGAVEFFRVLSARQQLAVARVRRLDALREAWRARLDLDRATASTEPSSQGRATP